MPNVSILLSAHNAAGELEQALASLQAQTIAEWQCFLMDDGSTDNTAALAARIASSDSRFTFLKHPLCKGLTTSLIEMSRQAPGEFLMRQDADDWSEPTRLEQQLEFLRHQPRAGVVGCDFFVHGEQEPALDIVRPFRNSRWIRRSLRSRNPLAHGSLLFRKSFFDQVGGYRAMFRYAQDYDLLLRLSEISDVGVVPQALYHHRLSPSGIGRAKRSQQSAYAMLAQACAARRRKGEAEVFLMANFTPPNDSISETPLGGPPAILLHLIKSNHREAADQSIQQWKPKTGRERAWRTVLICLNKCPIVFKTLAHQAYRLWQLIFP